MKQSMLLSVFVSLFLLTGCDKDFSEYSSEVSESSMQEIVVFRCANLERHTEDMGKESVKAKSSIGVYSQMCLTRSAIEADGVNMSDLWIFDYVDGELKQAIHQVASDDDFGSPTLKLDYGKHIVRFVASRGQAPTLSSEAIGWIKASDTFIAEFPVTVESGMQTEQSVTLERIATRLRLFVSDTFPQNASTLGLKASAWYTSLSLSSLLGVTPSDAHYTFDVKSLAGKKDVAFSVYSLCSSLDVWNTDVTLFVKDEKGRVITSVNVPNVELKANRTTVLSGDLFGKNNKMAVSLNSKWSEDYAQNF